MNEKTLKELKFCREALNYILGRVDEAIVTAETKEPTTDKKPAYIADVVANVLTSAKKIESATSNTANNYIPEVDMYPTKRRASLGPEKDRLRAQGYEAVKTAIKRYIATKEPQIAFVSSKVSKWSALGRVFAIARHKFGFSISVLNNGDDRLVRIIPNRYSQ